jgi:hypothetical protein
MKISVACSRNISAEIISGTYNPPLKAGSTRFGAKYQVGGKEVAQSLNKT